ncbi:hypothetical protein C4572_03040 [Candidatus Parcubacteria bacterium]|nr:MAG: hypothetical protein C4572_03040 [Candidatus Parcubacteria bacterium]
MEQRQILFAVFALFFAVAFVWFVFGGGARDGIPIMIRYDTKIVYTTDLRFAPGAFQRDCEARGGRFNECGNVCAPGAEICSTVCAYTCEFGF